MSSQGMSQRQFESQIAVVPRSEQSLAYPITFVLYRGRVSNARICGCGDVTRMTLQSFRNFLHARDDDIRGLNKDTGHTLSYARRPT